MKTNLKPANDTVSKSLNLRGTNNRNNLNTKTAKQIATSVQKLPTHSSKVK